MATATDVKNELARTKDEPPSTVKTLIRSMEREFALALPAHIPARSFLRTALSLVSATPQLEQCSQQSLLAALMECARLGLEPGTEQASLVPFNRQVTLIVGYQGYVELMYRSGMVESVVVDVIHERDRWAISRGKRPPDDFLHEPDLLAADRGPAVLAYAFAWLRGGARSNVVTLTRAQAEHIRDHDAKGSKRDDSPWRTHFDEMWIKSCVRRLRKWVPTSADIRELLDRADRVDNQPALRVDAEINQPARRTVDSTADDLASTAGEKPATPALDGGTGWPNTAQPPDTPTQGQLLDDGDPRQ